MMNPLTLLNLHTVILSNYKKNIYLFTEIKNYINTSSYKQWSYIAIYTNNRTIYQKYR
jgi:hypothetical protein